MKKNVLCAAVAILLGATNLTAANPNKTTQPYIGLGNYTVPVGVKGALIGYVMPADGSTKAKVELMKDDAQLFRIDDDGAVLLRKDKMLATDDTTISYPISLNVNGKRVDFELVRDDFKKNKVIAHRGAWKNTNVEQNSTRSFLEAAKLECEGSEFDVWLSSDKKVILSHDPTIGGHKVEETTVAEMQKTTLPKGDVMPTLEQFILEAKKQNKTKMILEIKKSQKGLDRTIELTDSAVAIVNRLNAQGWTDYISFSYESMQRVKELMPSAKVAYLETDKDVRQLKTDNLTGIDFHQSKFRSDTELTRKCHELGLTVNVWTVNKKEDLEYFYRDGVDFITTDEPEMLLQIIGSKTVR